METFPSWKGEAMDFPQIDRVEDVQDFLSEIGGKGLMGGFSVYFLLKEFLLLFQGKYQYKYSNAYEFKIF